MLGGVEPLRQEIESLALWWIPAFALTVLGNLALNAFISTHLENFASAGSFVSTIGWVNLVLEPVVMNLDHIVVSAWMFARTRAYGFTRQWLWCALGLFTGIIGGLIYFVLRVYENKTSSPPNE